MIGSEAIGRLALGQLPRTWLLTASASYSVTGNNGSFRVSEGALTGAYVETGGASSFSTRFALTAGSYVWTGFNANEIVFEAGAPSAYVVTGNAANLTRDFVNWLHGGKPSSIWGASGLPSSAWTPAGTPTTPWTADPAQSIPAPVTS
jgi:hypothetical protein